MNVRHHVGSVIIKPGREVSYLLWNIDSYIFRHQSKDVAWHSRHFKFLGRTWCFELNPYNEEYYIGLRIWRVEQDKPFLPLTYCAGIKNKDGGFHIVTDPKTTSELVFGTDKLIYEKQFRNERNLIAPEGHVTFFMTICPENIEASKDVSKSGNARNIDLECDIHYDEESLDILSRNLKEFFQKEEDSDVTFKVKGKEFHTHKSILAARSPVFASMFKHDMSEKNSGVVNIEDCNSEAFHELLLYFYCGKVDKFTSDTVIDLYEAATKYNLENLKEQCRDHIQELMCVDTFCDFITLVVKHDDSGLIKYATCFFIEHAKEILLSVKWQQFLEENPTTANELYLKRLEY